MSFANELTHSPTSIDTTSISLPCNDVSEIEALTDAFKTYLGHDKDSTTTFTGHKLVAQQRQLQLDIGGLKDSDIIKVNHLDATARALKIYSNYTFDQIVRILKAFSLDGTEVVDVVRPADRAANDEAGKKRILSVLEKAKDDGFKEVDKSKVHDPEKMMETGERLALELLEKGKWPN
ncbi:MAG: hypothetical protein Q9166_000868 [cf. Caloplaca sp. 2 TL-2023]